MKVMDDFFASTANLPMMPKVVQEVMLLLDDEDASLKDLVDKINHDPVISAKVLRLSNAAWYGHSRNIQTIDDAIALIGLLSLRTLVIASGVTSAFTTVPGMDIQSFWRHSLVTASIAREICKIRMQEAETAYLAALMHGIGQLPIHIVFPGAGEGIAEMCHGDSVLERRAIELATLGIDHCQVGERLAKRWNFPTEIQSAIRHYVDPLNPDAGILSSIVYVAAHIAFGLEKGDEAKYIAETLDPDVMQRLGFDRIEWIDRISEMKNMVQDVQRYLQ
jgi:HD-like signal output (HDOD) protein